MDEAGIHARLSCILNLPNHAPPLQQRSPTAHAALPMPTAAGGLRQGGSRARLKQRGMRYVMLSP